MNGIAQTIPAGSVPTKRRFTGTGLSRGVGLGRIAVLRDRLGPRFAAHAADPKIQIERFRKALEFARTNLIQLTSSGSGTATADILDVHLLILDSHTLTDRVEQLITSRGLSAQDAVAATAEELADKQSAAPDHLLAEKALDIRDAANRILQALGGSEEPSPPEGSVFAVRELTPQTVLELAARKPAAIITEHGGWTSHASIVARELKIPVVTGLQGLTEKFLDGTVVLVNGTTGEVIAEPDASDCTSLSISPSEDFGYSAEIGPLTAADGVGITLRVNADNVDVYEAAVRIGCRGIGLFRSEITLRGNRGFPTEKEQYEIYCAIAEASGEDGVRIRTFDVGTEQLAAGDFVERNPSLGLKSIRLSLTETDFFRTQIRALLRSSHGRNVSIVLPMISGVGEILRSKAVIEEEKAHLQRSGIPSGDPSVGVMIEVPSAVLMSLEICDHADFLCLGTNDLVQYLLAVDRDNEAVAEWYQSLHPAVIRAVETVAKAANASDTPASVCGEIAGSPFYLPLLLGLGIRELSVNIHSIAHVRRLISGVRIDESRELAESVKQLETSAEIETALRKHYQENWPHLFPAGLLESTYR
ncbi:MAG: phosphoenolpyruvate--protein phosphotransferase [Acidobacteria bacterium]|nr:phosphoenolpyruvate--protein phosphotransferase [Acidobacteriota bacterium]